MDEQPGRRPEPIRAIPVRHPGRWVAVAVIAVLTAMFVHLLVTNKFFNWHFVFVSIGPGYPGLMFHKPVLNGLVVTLELTVVSMVVGVLLGLLLAVMRLSDNPILRVASWGYIWFFRAVPRIVLMVLFGNLGILWDRVGPGIPFDRQLGALFGIHDLNTQLFTIKGTDLLSGFLAAVLALGLSEAAYMAEIVRAGMQSVDEGQNEASTALGLSRGQTLWRIVLPQAMRVIVPPTGNETIAMVKDTALAVFVPVTTELFFQLHAVAYRTFQVVPYLVAACLWYLVVCSILMVAQHYIERYFGRGYGARTTARARFVPSSRRGHPARVDGAMR
jgi:polar amino acid transport system permease protein